MDYNAFFKIIHNQLLYGLVLNVIKGWLGKNNCKINVCGISR